MGQDVRETGCTKLPLSASSPLLLRLAMVVAAMLLFFMILAAEEDTLNFSWPPSVSQESPLRGTLET